MAQSIRDCPGEDQLSDYSHGRASTAEIESIATHVAECERCEKRLTNIGPTDDSFVLELRQLLPKSADRTTFGASKQKTLLAFAESLPMAFGQYELLKRIGQGGMGIVFKARHRNLNRIVALKVATGLALDQDASAITRFRVEGEAVARLQHPSIVQLYDYGEEHGLPYFSMEMVDGPNLAMRLQQSPMSPREIANLVVTLARAVQAAHDKGVIHRDLKPANVLLANNGDVKLADFGLAKLLDTERHTQTDLLMGTAAYIAPEQTLGSGNVSPAIDIYGLGAILYEGLTGQPPFSAGSRLLTLDHVRHSRPVRPRDRNPETPAPLEAICLKCLEKSPRDRYMTAVALAEDLQRWLDGQVPSIWKRRWISRPSQFVRKRWSWIAAAIVVMIAAGGIAHVQRRATDDRIAEEIEQDLAKGDKVTLIGPTGLPRWSRLLTDHGQLTADSQGQVSAQSFGTGLFELARNPQRVPFRFAADIKHERSDAPGTVGIFFAYKRIQTPVEPIHQFIRFSFAEIVGFPFQPELKEAIPEEQLKQNLRVRLVPQNLAERSMKTIWGIQFPGESARYATVKFPGFGDWHRLDLIVREDEVEGTWDGKPVGPLKFARLLQTKSETLQTSRVKLDPVFLPYASIDFDTRGGLGIYVERSAALVRNAVIQFTP